MIKEKREKRGSQYKKNAPRSITELIPDNDYESTMISGVEGDYVEVCTYVYNADNSWMAPNDLIGQYIINTKSKTCVAYRKWKKGYTGKRDQFGEMKVTELGLLLIQSREEIFRIEDGGKVVKLFDKVPSTNVDNINDFNYKIIGTTIYYMNGDYDVFVVDNLTPAPLPTSEATAQAN